MRFDQFVIRALCLLGLWLGLGIQAHAQTDTVTYVYTDPQGTPLAKADVHGNIIARYDYTPYGNAVASLGSPPDGPGYTGHVNDPETGLVYMQARYFQPIGRFLSPDPVGPSPGNVYSFNRYAYANNNPIRYTDPDGRCVVCVIALGAIIAGAIDTSVQEWRHPDHPVNKTEVAIAAAGGAVTAGSASAFTGAAVEGSITVGQAVLRQAAVNGAVGGGQSVANDLADGKKVSGQRAVNAAGVNIATSLFGSGASLATGEFNGASTATALNDMSKGAVNAPAGIGSTISETTSSAGSSGAAQTTIQTAASQTSSAVLNAAGDVTTDKLNEKVIEQ